MAGYIFLSYKHTDTEYMLSYKKMLEENNYSVKLDEDMILGESWDQRAKRLIRNIDCKCVIFFISIDSIRSAPLLKELEYTIKYKVPYFAILLDEGSISDKFEKLRINHASDEELDIAESIMDCFPDEKIYVPHGKENSELILKALKEYAGEINLTTEETSKYIVIEGKDVTEDDIKGALELDKKYYGEVLDDDEQFTIEKCKKWFLINNMIYTMIKERETNRIVGYINATPVTNSCYEDIKNGKYADVNIDDEDIEAYLYPGYYNLYFASIVVDKDLYDFTILKKLCDAFYNKLINLLRNNFIITRVVADAISFEGRKMCEKFGMIKVQNETNHKSIVYELKLFPPSFEATSKLLKELQNEFYKVYNDINDNKN